MDDNKKIGIGLMGLGFGFIALGVVLFFDASLIAIGNVLFLVGLCFCIGIKGAWAIFTRLEDWLVLEGTMRRASLHVECGCRWSRGDDTTIPPISHRHSHQNTHTHTLSHFHTRTLMHDIHKRPLPAIK